LEKELSNSARITGHHIKESSMLLAIKGQTASFKDMGLAMYLSHDLPQQVGLVQLGITTLLAEWEPPLN
jgi:hypothetical protein